MSANVFTLSRADEHPLKGVEVGLLAEFRMPDCHLLLLLRYSVSAFAFAQIVR